MNGNIIRLPNISIVLGSITKRAGKILSNNISLIKAFEPVVYLDLKKAMQITMKSTIMLIAKTTPGRSE